MVCRTFTQPVLLLLTVAGMVFGLSACTGSYGKIVQNPGMMTRYAEQSLNPELRYYYCGRAGLPDAVVGIDPSYQFMDRLWFAIETLDEVYRKISLLSTLHPEARDMVTSDILGPGGESIGVWFSYYHHTPVRVDAQTREVLVHIPYEPEDIPCCLLIL